VAHNPPLSKPHDFKKVPVPIDSERIFLAAWRFNRRDAPGNPEADLALLTIGGQPP